MFGAEAAMDFPNLVVSRLHWPYVIDCQMIFLH
jgi:hypothetical protein